ncbi:hypothetical protein [Neorhizobium galegae]|uniref:hypothetical protein n=1 Tax=Neorhizobium galegae TaxID=399 RepID=UPI0006215955|nr:hypothetical protein [Neorhizobium galegae]CDZ54023.1 Hypothetical protein NGAL_HAMBI2427_54440 [Neorhizobium galegae bv. orientalis]
MSAQSLAAAIHRYRGEWNIYLANCLDDAANDDDVPRTYESALKVIETWDKPAEDLIAAAMALKLALEDYDIGDTPRIPAMMKAALGCIDAEIKRRTES